jgi:Family of unknown function (DUF5681)
VVVRGRSRVWEVTGASGCGRLGGIMSGGLTPWRKGQSGNPRGRPRVMAEVQELARQHTADAIEALVTILRRGKSESARVAAASVVLERPTL